MPRNVVKPYLAHPQANLPGATLNISVQPPEGDPHLPDVAVRQRTPGQTRPAMAELPRSVEEQLKAAGVRLPATEPRPGSRVSSVMVLNLKDRPRPIAQALAVRLLDEINSGKGTTRSIPILRGAEPGRTFIVHDRSHVRVWREPHTPLSHPDGADYTLNLSADGQSLNSIEAGRSRRGTLAGHLTALEIFGVLDQKFVLSEQAHAIGRPAEGKT